MLRTLSLEPTAGLDIAHIAFELAQDEYPALDVEASLSEIDAMAHEARRHVRGNLDGRVKGLCWYLFHEMGFRGNTDDYYDARNSYLNQVIERRTGIPISLSAVTMAVGQRVGLQVDGVGLPGHFIVKVVENEEEILVDPFHGGRRLTRLDCEHLVFQVTGREFVASERTLRATSLGLIVQRMLINLKSIYMNESDFPRAIRSIERLRQINPSNIHLRRDLGIACLFSGKPGQAIDHLLAYVQAHPKGSDSDAMRVLLKQARLQVAGLN